jgi:PBP1b-binding outer membrane lipoprotein LpoB
LAFFTIFALNILSMKRVICILTLILFINACSDGDAYEENLDFDDASVESCDEYDILYKLNDSEALIFQIPFDDFEEDVTDTDDPTTIDIDNSTYRVVYRYYDGDVDSDNVCSLITDSSPSVIEEWEATSGTIEITTTTVKSTDSDTNATTITGYNHNIVFKNITFTKPDGTTQVYESFEFGDYVATATTHSLDFDEELEQCSSSGQIYEYNTSESLTLDDIDSSLIVNEVTESGSPRTALIGTSSNILTYQLFDDSVLTSSYFCNTTTPSTPSVSEEWDAASGVDGVSGIIQVTTTLSGSTYTHTIVLLAVTLEKGNSSFYLGDSYTYGVLTTTD